MFVPMKRITASLAGLAALTGCATLSNEAMIPLSFTAPGCAVEMACTATNKRGSWSFSPPETVMVRRSDDTLRVECRARDGAGTVVTHAVSSEMEHAKMGASVLLLDFGITDAITDKHRFYPSNVVIHGCVR